MRGWAHRAAVIVRADDPTTLAELRGRRCAVNEVSSSTGYNLLCCSVADVAGGRPFLAGAPLVTGSHAASLAAVAEESADFAAVDGVTLAHLRRDVGEMTRAVRLLGWARSSPSLPFVTGRATPPERLRLSRRAIRQAVATLSLAARVRLMLRGVVASPPSVYEEVATIEREAAALGYPELV